MESTIKTPVQLAIAEFGGVRALARAIHRDPASVSKWQKGDGTIPPCSPETTSVLLKASNNEVLP